ncbi:MAG: 3-phosphoglycerate dehydrogenase [Betaproteobacteria bacterium RIFCSPLOWO2_02_FULL_65_24]|nr:MAG: 3-phosphoglycerate dehydrogenase [Betaproteobacteria bacterium RIFCSPLOWO2_02_FULL_65_24]
MRIAVIDDYQDAFRKLTSFPLLRDHEVVVFNDPERDPLRIAERLDTAGAEAVLLTQQRTRFPRTVIERLPKLKLISQTGTHTAHIDVAACTERGIVVSAGGGGNPAPTAELTWGLILASLRHIPYEAEQLKRGRWQSTLGVGLAGRTLGIYAYGRIGSQVAAVGRAFGMKVICWGREGSLKRARDAGFAPAASRDAFFATADVLSLHLPLNPETRGIVTGADLARMKPSALIVNTSRAPIIAEGALVEALKNGRPGFAAVDVFEEEPVLGGEHPLLKMDNVLATPHLGYVVGDNYESYYKTTIEQILAFAAGKPINVVNPEVLKKQ